MSNTVSPVLPNGISDIVQDRVHEAAPRVLATQFLDLVREPIIAALCDAAGIKGAQRTGVQRFAQGPAGGALLRLGLAAAVPFVPMIPREHKATLVREYQVSATAEIGNAIAKVIVGPISRAVGGFFSASSVLGPQVDAPSGS